MLPRLPLFSLLIASSLLGCDDLKDFRGTRSGYIVQGNFVRGCFKDKTLLTLTFDPDYAIPLADGGMRRSNVLSTDDGTFQDTPLDAIPHLPHDPLSEFDFPGPQRLRNYLMMARPDSGPLAGRDAFVVISLLASQSTEVRVIARSADGVTACPSDLESTDAGAPAGGPDGPAAENTRQYFGLWRLK